MRLQRDVDLYAVLGMPPEAVQDDLRKAYLSLAVQYHPDKNPGDAAAEERFKAISQAYAVLSDPQTRSRYDRLRLSKPRPRPAGPPSKTGAAARPAQPGAKAAGPKTAKPGSGREAGAAKAAGKTEKTGADKSAAAQAAAKSAFEGARGFQAAGQAKARPDPGRTRPKQERPAQAKARRERPDPSGRPAAGRSGAGPSGTGASKTGPASAGSASTGQSDARLDGDLMADLFNAAEGRKPLDQVQRELDQSGDTLDRLKGTLRQAVGATLGDSVKSTAGRFFKRLKDGFFSSPASSEPLEDIVFGLALSPEAAANGATIDISYLRDDKPHRLQVRIPPGVNDNARLRIAGQGHKSASGRGDLHLHLTIRKPDAG